jgi:hypothetical protein
MTRNGFASNVHFRRAAGVDSVSPRAKANAARSKVRSAAETIFATQRDRFGPFTGPIGVATCRRTSTSSKPPECFSSTGEIRLPDESGWCDLPLVGAAPWPPAV